MIYKNDKDQGKIRFKDATPTTPWKFDACFIKSMDPLPLNVQDQAEYGWTQNQGRNAFLTRKADGTEVPKKKMTLIIDSSFVDASGGIELANAIRSVFKTKSGTALKSVDTGFLPATSKCIEMQILFDNKVQAIGYKYPSIEISNVDIIADPTGNDDVAMEIEYIIGANPVSITTLT